MSKAFYLQFSTVKKHTHTHVHTQAHKHDDTEWCQCSVKSMLMWSVQIVLLTGSHIPIFPWQKWFTFITVRVCLRVCMRTCVCVCAGSKLLYSEKESKTDVFDCEQKQSSSTVLSKQYSFAVIFSKVFLGILEFFLSIVVPFSPLLLCSFYAHTSPPWPFLSPLRSPFILCCPPCPFFIIWRLIC